jgi:hypothetical protein
MGLFDTVQRFDVLQLQCVVPVAGGTTRDSCVPNCKSSLWQLVAPTGASQPTGYSELSIDVCTGSHPTCTDIVSRLGTREISVLGAD